MSPSEPQAFNRLLLIDDEPGIRRMMALDLGADGYQVETAEDGLSGLALFGRQRPDIVLTDLKMPGLDGLEVLRRIKQQSPQTEVIVITGHGDMDLAIRSLQLDASDFLTKPISDQALAVALKRARERLRLKAELEAHTHNLEERVAEATAKALLSERLAAVGQTVSSLVHSLKNMLAGLKGGNYLVREGLEKEQKHLCGQGLDMLERNLKRVGRLVHDLLTLAKPREPEWEQADLAALGREALDSLSAEAQDREVDLVWCEGPSGLVTYLEAEAVLDCLANLVGNALDAAATARQGRVRAGVEERGPEVCFWVQDNGPGLSEEAKAHIFEGFYSSKGAGGTGLGLMVCRKVAQEHGGRMEYESSPGQGATFRMVLPRLNQPPGGQSQAGQGNGAEPRTSGTGEEGREP